MGILDKLRPQPDWKHPDPEVRVDAVYGLADDALDVLVEIARQDVEPRVRLAAVGRLTDLDTLVDVARADPDEGVRDEAWAVLTQRALGAQSEADGVALVSRLERPRDLLEVAKTAVLEAVSHAALARITDAKSLSALARRASHAATRLAALVRVDEPDELAAIALKTDDRAVGLEALDRLVAVGSAERRETLERLAVSARSKPVARRARAMLKELEATAEPPAPQAPDPLRSEICARVERLGRSEAWDSLADDLAQAQRQWDEATHAAEAPAPELVERFTAAIALVEGRLLAQAEAHREASRIAAQSAAWADLCEQVERIGLDDPAGPDLIAGLRQQSLALSSAPEAAVEDLAGRFERACRAAEERLESFQRASTWRKDINAALDDFAATLGTTELADLPTRWDGVRSRWEGHEEELDAASRDRIAALERRVTEKLADAKDADDRSRRANLARLEQRCAQLETLLASETLTLKQAERMFRDARIALEARDPLPSKRDQDQVVARLKALQSAIYPRLRELREVDSWQRWANVGIQEELCRRVEGLEQVEDLAEVARQLRDAMAQWKAASAVPRERASTLWQRFKAAHDGAYARCSTYFTAQAAEREENLQRKLALCEQAEALASSSDWVRTAARIVELQAEWKALGPVPRKQAKAVWKRFRGACDQFFARRKADLADRKEVWAQNLARKTALCEQAEALADSSDWPAALSAIKRAQADWKTIGPVRKSRSEAIWQRFRTACDRFFERYQHRDDLELASKRAEREALCVEIEGLLPPEGAPPEPEAPEDLLSRVRGIRQRYQQAPPLPKADTEALAGRFYGAIDRLVVTYPARFEGSEFDAARVQQAMEELCERVEGLLGTPSQEAGLSPAEVLASRWREALASNTMGGGDVEASRRRAAAEEVRQAQAAWRRLVPLGGATGEALGARFAAACSRIAPVDAAPARAASGDSRRGRRPRRPKPAPGNAARGPRAPSTPGASQG